MKLMNISQSIYALLTLGLTAGALTSCDSDVWSLSDKSDGTYTTETAEPIATCLSEQEDYSEWVKVLNYTDYYGTLNQGSSVKFTHFVPTNEAVEKFYAEKGVATIEDLGKDYAQALVKFLTIGDDSIKLSEKFTSSKVVSYSISNVYSQMLTFTVDSVEVGYVLEGVAHVASNYISASNGFIYEISAIPSPLTELVWDRVADNSKYSIMTEALRATGYDKDFATFADTTVNLGYRKVTRRYYTFLTVSDENFAKDGIYSLSDLKSKLADRYAAQYPAGAAVTADSLLKQYVEYHTMSNSYTYSDLVTMVGSDTVRVWSTDAPGQIFMTNQRADAPIITAAGDTLYDVYYNMSDTTNLRLVEVVQQNLKARNGYVHELNSWLPVYEPKPTTVVWDLADNSKIRAFVGADYQPSEPVSTEGKYGIQSCVEDYKSTGRGSSTYTSVCYVTCKSNLKKCLNYDRVIINVGYLGYVTFKTPTLVRGKYKVTLDVAYQTTQKFLRTSDGCKGGLIKIAMNDSVDSEITKHSALVAPYTQISKTTVGVYTTTLYDEIEFDETASHYFKVVVMDPAASSNSNFTLDFDAITFTPIED
jgi:uncharacterized surface protein with fasciclin (FAS1) repeats